MAGAVLVHGAERLAVRTAEQPPVVTVAGTQGGLAELAER